MPIDEGQWLFFVQQLLDGKTLYNDVWYQFGPLLIIGLKGTMVVFEKTLEVERTYFACLSLLGLASLYVFSSSIIRSRFIRILLCGIVWVNSLTCNLIMVNPAYLFRSCFNLLPLYLIFEYQPKEKKSMIFLSGFFSYISILISQETGLFSLAAIMTYIFFNMVYDKKNASAILGSGGYFLSGFSFCLLIWMIYCLINHALASYVRISFIDILFMTNQYQHVPLPGLDLFSAKMNRSAYYHFLLTYLPLFVCAVTFVYAIVHKEKKYLKILSISVYGMFSFIILTGRGDIYHATFASLSLFLLLGVLYEHQRINQNRYLSVFFRISIAAFFGLILFFNMDNIKKFFEYHHLSKSLTYDSHLSYLGNAKIPKYQYEKIYTVKTLVEKNSAKNDPVLYLVHSPYYYFFIDRHTDTKYASPVFANTPNAKSQIVDAVNQKEYKLIVFDKTTLFPNIDYNFYFSELNRALKLNYDRLLTVNLDLVLLSRKEALENQQQLLNNSQTPIQKYNNNESI